MQEPYWDHYGFGFCPVPEPVWARGEWVGFFHIYADESGKLSGNSDYTALCGYVGHQLEWQKFSFMWQQLSLRWGGIPPIHMAKIMRDPSPSDPEWAKMHDAWEPNWQSRRDQMLGEFAQLIFNSNIFAVGTVIDAREYRAVQKGPKYKFPIEDSNVFLFQELLTTALDRLAAVDPLSPISVIVDDDQQTAFHYYEMLKSLKINPRLAKIKERVVEISFGNDRAFPGIQAADMISFESRKSMVSRLTAPDDRPSELYHWLTHGGINQPRLIDAALLRKMAEECSRRTDEINAKN